MANDTQLEPDDAELVRRSRTDPAAFRTLYDRHAAAVHAFLLRRTGDPASAFELTSETFAGAWLGRERFRDLGIGAAPWLFGIARNVLAASVRARSIPREGRRRIGLDAVDTFAAPRDEWIAGLDEDLARALASLPDSQRRAVELRVLERTGYDEIGRELRVSPGAARVRVHRGLAALRALLRPGSSTAGPVARPPHPITPSGDHR
jgi:RNA polymerase sigma factor (sigma-70 family)